MENKVDESIKKMLEAKTEEELGDGLFDIFNMSAKLMIGISKLCEDFVDSSEDNQEILTFYAYRSCLQMAFLICPKENEIEKIEFIKKEIDDIKNAFENKEELKNNPLLKILKERMEQENI